MQHRRRIAWEGQEFLIDLGILEYERGGTSLLLESRLFQDTTLQYLYIYVDSIWLAS